MSSIHNWLNFFLQLLWIQLVFHWISFIIWFNVPNSNFTKTCAVCSEHEGFLNILYEWGASESSCQQWVVCKISSILWCMLKAKIHRHAAWARFASSPQGWRLSVETSKATTVLAMGQGEETEEIDDACILKSKAIVSNTLEDSIARRNMNGKWPSLEPIGMPTTGMLPRILLASETQAVKRSRFYSEGNLNLRWSWHGLFRRLKLQSFLLPLDPCNGNSTKERKQPQIANLLSITRLGSCSAQSSFPVCFMNALSSSISGRSWWRKRLGCTVHVFC